VLERYEINLSPEEEQQFDRDPYSFARDYLEHAGFKVREIMLAQKEGKQLGRWSEGYHIVYPGNESSGWI
jgi:hypothetical protein